jgi:hypothetical protein
MGKPYEDYSCAQELHFLHEISNGFHSLNMQMEKKSYEEFLCQGIAYSSLDFFQTVSLFEFADWKKNLIRKRNSRVSTEQLQSSSARDWQNDFSNPRICRQMEASLDHEEEEFMCLVGKLHSKSTT